MVWNGFRDERFDVIRQIEAHHFWFSARRKLIQFVLHRQLTQTVRTIADIGCGTGYNLGVLAQFTKTTVGLDRHAGKITRPGSMRPAPCLVAGDVELLPFEAGSIDVVLALDVLEHVADAATLHDCRRVLRSGGVLLVMVPAVPWLWSFRDEDAGHLRRYTRRSLSECAAQAGFEVEYVRFYQFFLFPLVMISRLLGKSVKATRNMEDRPPAALNAVLRAINLFEVKLIAFGLRFPIGSSLLMVARKL